MTTTFLSIVLFDASTDSALLDFQDSNNIYPSHTCDDLTLRKLAE
jgi:hypothetical protein